MVKRSGTIRIRPSVTAAGGGLSHGADLDEPLLTGHRLDDCVAALAVTDGVSEWFGFVEEAVGFEILEDAGSALCYGHAGVLGPSGIGH